jgi:hypothetical protein
MRAIWIWFIVAAVVIAALYANYTGYLTFGYTPPTQTLQQAPASAATMGPTLAQLTGNC